MQPAPVSEPFTAPDLVRDFRAVEPWARELWESFGVSEFFEPLEGGWSPADHVRHLTKSNRPVAWALSLPRVVLLLRFGFTRRPSLSYSALEATYHEALTGGLRAGRFTPAPLPPDQQTAEERLRILSYWSDSLRRLTTSIDSLSERALSRLRLPHPGLGMLTLREMLLFTLYHNTHHVNGVARRKGL